MAIAYGDGKLPFPTRSWDPEDQRPRVLVESSDPAIAWGAESALERAGYDVAVCWGPSSQPGDPCPLLQEGGHCELAEGADAIVQSVTLVEQRPYLVPRRLQETAPDIPICVEVSEQRRAKSGPELEGCHVIGFPMTSTSLVEAVNEVTGQAPAKPKRSIPVGAPTRRTRRSKD